LNRNDESEQEEATDGAVVVTCGLGAGVGGFVAHKPQVSEQVVATPSGLQRLFVFSFPTHAQDL